MAGTWKYKRADFIKTAALKRYSEQNGLSLKEIAEQHGEDTKLVYQWVARNRAPKPFLEKLGIKARNTTPKADNNNLPKGGSFYACYVGAEQKDIFERICKLLEVSAKFVV